MEDSEDDDDDVMLDDEELELGEARVMTFIKDIGLDDEI